MNNLIASVILSLISSWLISNYFIERYKKQINEQSEVFKRKLDIFQNFIKKEYLANKQVNLDSEVKTSLEYYWDIWLIADIGTLNSIIEEKQTDIVSNNEYQDEQIISMSNVFVSMRRELNGGKIEKWEKEKLYEYSKFLDGLYGLHTIESLPNAARSAKTQEQKNNKEQADIKKLITSSNLHKETLGNIITNIHSGYYLKKELLAIWDDVDYVRIQDIISFSEIISNKIGINDIVEKKIIKANNLLLISVIGTIWKTCYLNDNRKLFISSTLAYWFPDLTKIDPIYLSLLFKTKFVQEQLNQNKRWIAQQFVTLSWVSSMIIPVAPLNIQKIITKYYNETNDIWLLDALFVDL